MCNLVMKQITGTRLEEYAEELSLADLKRDTLGISQQLISSLELMLRNAPLQPLAQYVIIEGTDRARLIGFGKARKQATSNEVFLDDGVKTADQCVNEHVEWFYDANKRHEQGMQTCGDRYEGTFKGDQISHKRNGLRASVQRLI
jgi:hypothetical protein